MTPRQEIQNLRDTAAANALVARNDGDELGVTYHAAHVRAYEYALSILDRHGVT